MDSTQVQQKTCLLYLRKWKHRVFVSLHLDFSENLHFTLQIFSWWQMKFITYVQIALESWILPWFHCLIGVSMSNTVKYFLGCKLYRIACFGQYNFPNCLWRWNNPCWISYSIETNNWCDTRGACSITSSARLVWGVCCVPSLATRGMAAIIFYSS